MPDEEGCLLRIILLTCAFLCSLQFAQADEQKFALIIGNEAYPNSVGALTHPHEDAIRMRDALLASGFPTSQTVLLTDADKVQTLQALMEFAGKLRAAGPDAIGFLYYSGHGGSAQTGPRRQNYLIPSNAAISGAEHLPLLGISVSDVIDSLAATNAKAVFVVFDACRDTLPLASSTKGTSPDKGMVRLSRKAGMFIAFATADGETTPDDGLFSKELSAQIRTPGLSADRAFTLAARRVTAQRPGAAQPFWSDGLTQDICFAGCDPDSSPLPAAATGAQAAPAAAPYDLSQLPEEFASIARQARENRAIAERYAAQGEQVRELAEQAADMARRISNGAAVNGYSFYKADNGNDYAGQVKVDGNTTSSDGYGVSIVGTAEQFGNRIYCRWVTGEGCLGSGAIEYGVNGDNAARLQFWAGEIGPKGPDGWGHLQWVPRDSSTWVSDSWAYNKAGEIRPGTWIRQNGQRFEGEIGNTLNGKAVLWTEDGKVHTIGIWENGKVVENFTWMWRDGMEMDFSEPASQFRRAWQTRSSDQEAATSGFRSACRGGYLLGCAWYGKHLIEGTGIKRNVKEGVKQTVAACEGGFGGFCVNAAEPLLNGDGIAKDPAKAAALLRKGCTYEGKHGSYSCFRLGLYLTDGTITSLEPGEAKDAMNRSCLNNYIDACTWLQQPENQ